MVAPTSNKAWSQFMAKYAATVAQKTGLTTNMARTLINTLRYPSKVNPDALGGHASRVDLASGPTSQPAV
jgi:hypothetical protein